MCAHSTTGSKPSASAGSTSRLPPSALHPDPCQLRLVGAMAAWARLGCSPAARGQLAAPSLRLRPAPSQLGPAPAQLLLLRRSFGVAAPAPAAMLLPLRSSRVAIVVTAGLRRYVERRAAQIT